MTTGDGISRRSAFAGVGLVALSTAALTGCGDEEPAGSGAVLGDASEVPVGGGKVFTDDLVVVTQPAEGQFRAFSAVCTHQKCPVANVEGGTINCNCHGSKFSITDGSVVRDPAEKPLPAVDITVEDGTITVA